MKPNLTIDVKQPPKDKDYQVIVFNGEFDKAGHSEVKEELEKAIEDFSEKNLVFDFSGLKFINSEGIGYLMEIHTHLVQRGRKLVIVGVKPNVADVFKAIGIQEVVPIHKDLTTFLNK